jgi:guanylate kinase
VHYRFIGAGAFETMREKGELLESAKVHGNYYGTPLAPVEEALSAGRDVLFDIDWQGTMQIYDKMRPDIVSVFVLPPSVAELKARLERRAEDSSEIILQRLQNARVEISHWTKYDYVLVNQDLQTTYDKLKEILDVERMKRQDKSQVSRLVDSLKADLDALTRGH